MQHSMVIYDNDTFIGVNNGRTFGEADKQDEFNHNNHTMTTKDKQKIKIERFGGIFGKTYQEQPSQKKALAGWDAGDNFHTVNRDQQEVVLLPTRGKLEEGVREKLGKLRETLTPGSHL